MLGADTHMDDRDRFLARRCGALACAVAAVGVLVSAAPQQPQVQGPTFRSSVDVVAVDVQVVDRDGQPIAGLGADDFDVSIDNRRHRVLTAELVQYDASATRPSLSPITMDVSRAAGVTLPAGGPSDRVYVLAVDETSFAANEAQTAMVAARHFIDRLQKNDIVGLYLYPYGSGRLDLFHDHFPVSRSLSRVVGRRDSISSEFHLTMSEVVDIAAGNGDTFADVLARECNPRDPFSASCPGRIRAEVAVNSGYLESLASQSLGSLRDLVRGLTGLPGRKTLVVVSGGLASSDRAGGRPDVSGLVLNIGEEASLSNTNVYMLHIDSSFLEAFSANGQRPTGMATYGDGLSTAPTFLRDGQLMSAGLERVAAASGGKFLRVQAGTSDSAFDRVLRETSAYYLLGVEPVDIDRNDRLHVIRVKVNAKGAAVQNRTSVFIPKVGR